MLWDYAREAEAVAVGSTGGGPDIPGHPQVPALDWDAFSRDLLLAHHWCDHLLVHSLEGCVWQGFLPRLRTLEWDQPVSAPRTALVAKALRALLRGSLWGMVHPRRVLVGAVAVIWLLRTRARR